MKVTKWMRKKAMNRLVKVENLNISKRERRIKRTIRWAIIATCAWVIPFTTEYTEHIVIENVYAGAFGEKSDGTSTDGSLVTDRVEVADERDGESLEAKISRAFPEAPEVMIAIAKAESGMNPNARNINKNGSSDIGLFQINSIHDYDELDMFDPDKNIEAARAVYEKQGLRAWVVFQTGAYEKFL